MRSIEDFTTGKLGVGEQVPMPAVELGS